MVQNGRISDFHGLLTLTLTLDPGMVITFFSSLIEYYLYTKFHRNRRNFLWTDDVRTYGHTDGKLGLLGRLPKFGSRPKNSKIAFLPPCGGLRGNVHGSYIARWKACGGLPISANWTFFASFHA